MAYRVLVVDDSTFFRRRVKEILDQDPQLSIVGDARNGEEAVDKVAQLRPDVVTMDVEMPVMDGITAVRKIMASHPVPILMFSSLTHDGAEATLDALDAGALDFLPKKFEDIAGNRKEAIDLLHNKVKALGRRSAFMQRKTIASQSTFKGKEPAQRFFRSNSLSSEALADKPLGRLMRSSGKSYQVLAIGTSTGGPVALQTILGQLPDTFPYPIILIQHMPGTFTKAFAERLNKLSRIKVKEAQDGDTLHSGCAYLAPGGRQMLLTGSRTQPKLKVTDVPASREIAYKPSVDITFSSIANVFGGEVLGIILTGMGADGREGCRSLHAHGATIWAQDEKTCVVYGMPQAIANANLAHKSLALDDIGSAIQTEMQGSR